MASTVVRCYATIVGVVTVKGNMLSRVVGEFVCSDVDSIKVDGKSAGFSEVMSFGVGGGSMSVASSFRFLPFGAGSNGGERLYVTVLVTTDLTLTGFDTALLGVSKNRRVALSGFQSAGENGE
jgi:hypothetical protein